MISFRCSQCGLGLQADDRFAGQRASCPNCKYISVVPGGPAARVWNPPQQMDGPASSLARAGLAGGVILESLAPDATQAATQRRSLAALIEQGHSRGQRYQLEGEMARGGMGAVLRAVDCDIRREVAVKYLLDQADPHKQARFIEEAQITGQLDHPNIVPIHELGVDGYKRLFFSMKMVRGRSLAEAIRQFHNQQARNLQQKLVEAPQPACVCRWAGAHLPEPSRSVASDDSGP